MEYGKYYTINTDKLEWVLLELEKLNYLWRENVNGSPIKTYFQYSININWDNDTPVLEVEQYKDYKFIKLTSLNLLETNGNEKEIYSYEDFLKDVNLL